MTGERTDPDQRVSSGPAYGQRVRSAHSALLVEVIDATDGLAPQKIVEPKR